MLVIDTGVLLAAAAARRGFAGFPDPDLVAPPIVWSEARSVLHEALRRGDLPASYVRRVRRAVERAPVTEVGHPALGDAAWDVAERLRLARTYAAEPLALARLLGCALVTLDAELARRGRGLARVVGPAEVR